MQRQDITTGIIIVALIVAAIGITYAALQYFYSISNQGNILSISCVVQDAAGLSITNINWGTLDPGSTTDKLVYVKNDGSVQISLSIATEAWIPVQASDYLTLSWNYTGQILNPNDQIPAILTLTVSSDVADITTFEFTTVITATEA